MTKRVLNLRDVILGGQDGLVNVLGVVLGVAAATYDLRLILISGLAATFAESISMAAVAYTSTEASLSEYNREKKLEEDEVEKSPLEGRSDVQEVFRKWGFDGDLLEKATQKITSDKKLWVEFMMSEEVRNQANGSEKPAKSTIVVGTSSLLGSLIPLIPFFFLKDVILATYGSFLLSASVLFLLGFIKAKETIGNPYKSGIKICAIGTLSAIVGFILGKLLGGISV